MKGKNGRLRYAAMAMVLSLTSVRGVAAQWTALSYGVAEVDTKHTLLLLAGVSASPKGSGVQPLVGLQAYHLGYDVGSTRTNVFTVKPDVGLKDGYNGGEVYGTIGYAFSNKDVGGPVVAADRGQGVDVSAGWDHWGTGGPWGYQALGSYNFGSKSSWSRGRITSRISQSGQSSTRLGAEVAYLSGTGYSAWQPGGVLEWHFPQGQILGFGAGAKIVNSGGNAAYFKLEGLLPLVR